MPGVARIVSAFDGADGGPVPVAFVAVAMNVYVEPSVRPANTIGLDAPDTVAPPGDAVTV